MTAPASAQIDLQTLRFSDPATLVDPWETYRVLRDEAPVFEASELGIKIVTRYDLVAEALRDPDTYSNASPFIGEVQIRNLLSAPEEIQKQLFAINAGRLPPANTLITADPPVHTRYRSQVSGLFTAGRIKRAQADVDRIISEALDDLVADAPNDVDFIARFANPVPLRIIADRLGVPEADRAFFYRGATAAAALLRMTVPPPDEMLERARLLVELEDYMGDLVEERRKAPQDDLCSALAAARIDEEERELDHAEVWSILNQFLVAGHETTSSASGFAILRLCEDPSLQDRLRGDEARIRVFVEEVLRLDAPVQGLPRVLTRDTELGGVPLAKGETIMLRFGAANRDERQFPDPDVIDLERKHAGAHFAFGSGTHHCPGAPLSRQELNRGVLALLDRVENLRLAPGRPAPAVEPSLLLRSLPELWVRFERRETT